MAQIVAIFFFLGVLAGGIHLIAAMLGDDWARIVAALEGREMASREINLSAQVVNLRPVPAFAARPLRVAA